jgi:hypothetical protein
LGAWTANQFHGGSLGEYGFEAVASLTFSSREIQRISGDIMAATEMVHVRVEKRVKAKAAKALAAMGLSVSVAQRVVWLMNSCFRGTDSELSPAW